MLVIVKTEIYITQRSIIAYFIRIDKTQLVERSTCLVFLHASTIERTFRCRIVESHRYREIIATENTNTGRIGTHNRHVTTQGTHGTAHSDKTGSSIQIIAQQTFSIVCVLCISSHSQHQATHCYHTFLYHNVSFFVVHVYLLPPPLRLPPPLDERELLLLLPPL